MKVVHTNLACRYDYSMKAMRFSITGLVQGVGFRWYTMKKAKALGLTGWVRNKADGSVEALAEGSEEAIDNLEQFLKKGSLGAKVQTILKEETECSDRYSAFEVTF